MESNRRVTTVRQLELLVEFLVEHPDLALGKVRSKEARATATRLWAEVAEILNVEGPERSHKEWTKVWNDLKCRIRGKLVSINANQRGTGGGPNTAVVLSPLEEKVARILGRDVGPLQNVAQNHFANTEAQYCEKAGADSLLTLPELYFRPQSVSDLVFYVEQVARAAPSLPLLYYNFPKMSKVEINMRAFVTAATERIPNFKGLKYSSNDLSEAAEILRVLKEDQEIFLGAASLLAPAVLLGFKSSIATAINLFPHLALDIFKAMENNDLPKAKELQEKLSLAVEVHAAEGAWVPAMKAGMEIVTNIKVGPPALPQRALSNEAKKRIASKLKNLGLA